MKRKNRWRIAGVVAACVALGLMAVPVLANLPGSDFDAGDGNLVLNDEAKDWVNAPNFAKSLDLLKGQGDNAFGQGTSEDDPVPNLHTDGIPPNKSDITRFYKGHETVSGDTLLYLGWERISDPTGTTNFDFELNQSDELSANGETPVRTKDDILIKYDLSNGGTNPQLGFHKWVTSSSQSAGQVCEASSKFPCWDKVHPISSPNFEASINSGTVTDPIAPNAPRSLSPRTFGEAAVNLTDAGIVPAGDCKGFAQAYLKSRSSDSFNSALKDFSKPLPADINVCQPATVKLKKLDENGQPLAGATMQLFKDENGDKTLDDGDTQVGEDCTTGADGIGDCIFQLPGASSSDGTYIGHEEAAPPGYECCAPDKTQDVKIGSSAQEFVLEFADELAPGQIDITKEDDAGNALAGAEFTLYEDKDPVGGTRGNEDTELTTKTCTTGSDGKCTISDVDPGNYWVVETKTPDNHDTAPDQAVTVDKGTEPGEGETVPVTFENPRQHRVVVLVCHEGTDTLAPSDVTLDAVKKESLSGVGLTPAQEKALCDTGGASYGGISGHPTKSAAIDVGSGAHSP